MHYGTAAVDVLGAPNRTLERTELPPVIDGAINTISQAALRVADIAGRVQVLADATFGPVPSQPGGPSTGAASQAIGRAEILQRASGDLHGAISNLESQFDRLRNI